MQDILSIQRVSKQYCQQPGGVLDISFSVPKGQITAIIGESGSGKSTLLKAIYGTLKVDEGNIYLNDKRVKGPDEQLVPGHPAMRMVTQDFSLNIYAKVYDNISAMLANTDIAGKERKTREAMDQLRISHLQDKRITELSGGEQQRVAIARALVGEIDVLLLDEPFSQVDTILKKQLREDIERLARFLNITIIMVSHDPSDGLSLSDKLIVIREGQIIRQGKAKDIYHDPQYGYVAQLLGKANVIKGLGFLPDKDNSYAVYPNDVYMSTANDAVKATVKSVHFNGFYNEVEYSLDGKSVISYDLNFTPLKKGDEISIAFRNLMKVDFS
ncbi:MAG: ABC transporter ATP-binding protein [Pedobacter sp.]|nr:MAG: ABC transporter ATP-binding protein [Pedobacter sp.]